MPEYGSCTFAYEDDGYGGTRVTGSLASSTVKVHVLRSRLYPGPSAHSSELRTPCGALAVAYEILRLYEKFQITAFVNLSAPTTIVERSLPAAAHMQQQLHGEYAEMTTMRDGGATYSYKQDAFDDQDETPEIAASIGDVRAALERGDAVDAIASFRTLPKWRRIGGQPRAPELVDMNGMYREYERKVADAFDIPVACLTGSQVNQRRDVSDQSRLVTSVSHARNDLQALLSEVGRLVWGADYVFNIPVSVGVDVATLKLGREMGVLSHAGLVAEFLATTGVAVSSLSEEGDEDKAKEDEPKGAGLDADAPGPALESVELAPDVGDGLGRKRPRVG